MRLSLALFSLLFSLWVQAGTEIKGLRLWAAPDYTRLVFDANRPLEHDIFTLHDPERVVIDFKANRIKAELKKLKKNRHIKKIRSAPKGKNQYRVVLDLKQSVRVKSFSLKPNQQYQHHRLVIDLFDKQQKQQVVRSLPKSNQRDVIIVVDAGHGGERPGAVGRRSKEKDITLAIAKKLKALIDKEPGMKAVMTRSGDYDVGLRQRTRIARRHQADFFVSIHADSFKNKKAHGASVFVLSHRGASSEAAAWLARKENADDLIGGLSLDDKDDMVASVLLDLAQSGTISASTRAAEKVRRELGKIAKLHGNKGVQKAAFIVLKSPDIPSILVETGFISNPSEEKKLNNSRYQQKIARAIFKGIRAYFYAEPPQGTRIAALKKNHLRYTIRRGDTLSSIAQKHKVKVSELKRINHIKSDRIRVGQVLRIPKT